MSNRLRGMLPAYRMGRLDEYIKLRFGGMINYENYIILRWHYNHSRIHAVKTDLLGRGNNMTKLEYLLTLYNTGLVLQWGRTTYGLYPLRWLGRILLRRKN